MDDVNEVAIKLIGGKYVVYEGARIVSLCSDETRADEIADALKSEHAAGALPTETLTNIDIFRAGAWTDSAGRATKWTTADLDEMVANFTKLRDRIRPFFKMRHLNKGDENKITGGASLGWPANLRRIGDRLVADITDVPAKLAQLIRAGRFVRISSEIWRQFKDEATGEVHKNVLSAVGLLGAQHPAVTTLDDIVALHEGGAPLELPESDTEWTALLPALGGASPELSTFCAENTKSRGGEQMDEAQVKKLIADAKAEAKEEALAELQADIDKEAAAFKSNVNEALGIDADADPVEAAKAFKENAEKAEAEATDRDRKEFEDAVTKVVDTAKADGKLLPAHEAGIRSMVSGWELATDDDGKMAFTEGKDEKRGTVVEALNAHFASMAKVVSFSESAPTGDGKGGAAQTANIPADVARSLGDTDVPRAFSGEAQDAAIRAHMKENDCGYVAAFQAVNDVIVTEPDASGHSFSAEEI